MATKHKAGEASDGLKDCLECPVCMECPMFPPIRQCTNGHVICDECSTRVSKCPTCRTTPVNIRNRLAEQIANNIEVPCKFAPHCIFKSKYADYTTHVESCGFKPIACLLCDEDLVMSPEAIVDHYVSMHRILLSNPSASVGAALCQEVTEAYTVRGSENILNEKHLKPSESRSLVTIISAFDQTFMAFVVIHGPDTGNADRFEAWLQYIGPKHLANSWAYDVSVKAQSRTLLFGGVPRSLSEKPSDIKKSNDCLVFDRLFRHMEISVGLEFSVSFTIRHNGDEKRSSPTVVDMADK